MWVFDGERWTEEGGNCGNEAPGMVDHLRYPQPQPQLQIQEILPAPPAHNQNLMPWVPARRIKP